MKFKVFAATLLFASCYFLSLGQNTNSWSQISNFSGSSRLHSVAFTIGDNSYVGLGNDGNNFLSDFYKYDYNSNQWSSISNFTVSARDRSVAFSINGKGYVGLGFDNAGYKNDFYEYDPVSNSWNQIADFPGSPRIGAVAFSLNGKGYVGTGADIVSDKVDFYEYDPVTNSWSQIADFPGLGRRFATAFSTSNFGYVGTGTSTNINLSDFWKYDQLQNNWEQMSSLPGPSRSAASSFSINNSGFVGTGFNSSINNLNDFWEYKETNNTWIQRASFMGSSRFLGVGFSINETGFIGLGYSNSNEQDFYQYIPFCQSWDTTIYLTICDSLVINNQVYNSSGLVELNYSTSLGCDSTINLNLTVLSPTTSSISPVVCNSYSSPSGSIYFQSGTYIDTIQNVIGCDSIITINLSVVGTLNVNAGPNLNVCLGNSIVLTATGATNYVWSNGISNGVAFTPSLTDYYFVTGTDGNGCLGQDSVLVTVYNPPTISFNYILPDCEGGLTGSINTQTNGANPISYQWSTGSTNQNLQDVSAGAYNLIVIDGNGCSENQNFNLPDGEGDCLLIPTGFTPNGDNQNDTWQIIGIENFAKNNVQVFNRWGQTVFESQGTPVNWSGKYKDEMLPIADYYFVVDLGNGQVFNGTVTLKY